jgi:hypothetical protein
MRTWSILPPGQAQPPGVTVPALLSSVLRAGGSADRQCSLHDLHEMLNGGSQHPGLRYLVRADENPASCLTGDASGGDISVPAVKQWNTSPSG